MRDPAPALRGTPGCRVGCRYGRGERRIAWRVTGIVASTVLLLVNQGSTSRVADEPITDSVVRESVLVGLTL